MTGLGEASFFVGAASAAQDLAPPGRRAEAASFFSLAIWGGMSFGPVAGEWIGSTHGIDAVWIAAAICAAVGAAVAAAVPRELGRVGVTTGPRAARRLLHPAGRRTGLVLLLGMAGVVAFTAFLPLHLDDLGMAAGTVFLVHGVVVLGFRIFGARLPDRLGARRVVTASMAASVLGCLALAVASSEPAVYAATIVYSLGNALLMPTLMSTTVTAAPDAERGQAVATVSLSIDLAQGMGAPLLGLAVALSGTEVAAFVVAAFAAAAALVLARDLPGVTSGVGSQL